MVIAEVSAAGGIIVVLNRTRLRGSFMTLAKVLSLLGAPLH